MSGCASSDMTKQFATFQTLVVNRNELRNEGSSCTPTLRRACNSCHQEQEPTSCQRQP